jgi:hypothetical protein
MSHITRVLTAATALALLGAPAIEAKERGPRTEQTQKRSNQSKSQKTRKDTPKQQGADKQAQPAADPQPQSEKQVAPTPRPQESRPTARPPTRTPEGATSPSSPSSQSGPGNQTNQPNQPNQLGQTSQPGQPGQPDQAATRRPDGLSTVGSPASAKSLAPAHSAARITPTKAAPVSAVRTFDGTRYTVQPLHRRPDHRYARPGYAWLHPHPAAHYVPPRRWHYRAYYARWWVHPWWRWRYATVAVVSFHFTCSPWVVTWAPPARVGFYWVPEAVQYDDGAPDGYTWVPGWWEGEVYIEGYWRLEYRADGDWVWIDGRYLDDGTYARAHWRPAADPPAGYAWEPGFWDGEGWVDGFWRPTRRSGFTWVEAYYDDTGIFNTGYWYPLQEESGQVWIPGWFDGNEWLEGYWVDEREYRDADIDAWQPEEGWDAGWDSSEAPEELPSGAPLAMPVEYPEG